MAKINVEIDLENLGDYIDYDDGDVDFNKFIINEVESKIIEKAVSNIKSEQLKVIEEKVESKMKEANKFIEEALDRKVNDIADELLERNITIYNSWGDVVKDNVKIIDLFKEKMDNFLTEKVNSEGKTTGYNRDQTRIDYLVNKNITFSMERKVKEAAQQVSKKIEEYVNKTLKEEIGEQVSKVIGLDKITSKIGRQV